MKFLSNFSICFSSISESITDGSRVSTDVFEDFCVFSYDELKIATRNFHSSNKIGEGGIGSVYKGWLGDGTVVAVKVFSVDLESMKGEREFISEIAALSDIKHENLVTLRGCCVDGANRYLVYQYMENNSLARTLHGKEQNRVKISWEVRRDISLGIARGIAFLHEEVKHRIVHRDIKASNILLDQNFTPKVSDFGLAKLIGDNSSHISTRVAGTLGYLAPEYAITGHLTRKSDVYSFGVLLLEIISGRLIVDFDLEHGEHYLVEKAWEAYKANNIIEIVDPALGMNFPEEEAILFLKVGLLCVQETAKLRPHMLTAFKMLANEIDITDCPISQPGLLANFMDVKIGQRNITETTISKFSSTCSTSSTQSLCSRTYF